MNDIDAGGRIVTGFRVVAEAIARRWMTPRGRLIGYPDYGFDLTDYVNADVSPRDLAELRAGASAEAEKDERVIKCDVDTDLTNGVLTITAVVTTTKGPFTLTVAVSDVSVTLLDVQS